jgi:ATP/maltotriose-dependent transcriptional regulator MalT
MLHGRLLARQARIRYFQGRPADAKRLAEEAIELAQANSDLEALAEALEFADIAATAMGVPDATARIERAIAIYAELGDLGGEARVRNTIGAIAYFLGRWPQALEHYRAAEDLYERSGQRWAAAISACNMAEILADQGHVELAESALGQAMATFRGVGAAAELAFGECQLGRVAACRGRTEEALRYFAAAREYYRGAGESTEEILVDGLTAESLTLAGAHAQALALVDAALTRASGLEGIAAATPLLLRVRAAALRGLARHEEAVATLRESLVAARRREASHDVAFALRELLSAAPAVSGGERSEWRRELDQLERQLGIVARSAAGARPGGPGARADDLPSAHDQGPSFGSVPSLTSPGTTTTSTS